MEKVSSDLNIRSQINNIISPELVRLTGFIFNYENSSWYNTSLFGKYLDVPHEVFLCGDTFVLAAKESLNRKRDEFEHVYDIFTEVWKNELWKLYEYYEENFSKLRTFFDLLELYIPLEAEKIYVFQHDGEDFLWEWGSRESHISSIDVLESKIFGEKISDQEQYAGVTLDYLASCYSENGSQLHHDDRVFYNSCIEKITSSVWVSDIDVWDSKMSHTISLQDTLSGENKDILDKEISREQYIEIFTLAIEILGLDGVEVVLKDVKNISVSPTAINIPSKDPSYDILTVKRIIGLISHELERHAIWNANNKALVWNLKSLSYLWQEEWVAHIMEHLALWYDLHHMPLNRYMPRMLAWEVLNWSDFKRFLGIMNTLDGQSIDIDNFFKRFKRWRNYDLPWVNPKEKLYGIWALEVIDQLQKGTNPLSFFLAKNSSDEQEIINNIVLWENEVMDSETLDSKGIVLPLMLGDLIRFKLLSQPEEDESKFLRGFMKYFHERYWELFEKLWFNFRDFIVKNIKDQREKNKQKVSQILEIIQS